MDYLSLTLGILLSISEFLPFVKKIQGNGIINVLQLYLQSYLTKQSEIARMDTEPLIAHQNTEGTQIPEVTVTFTLKTPDEYQLMFIENSIKNNFKKRLDFDNISDKNYNILKSLGYKIEYQAKEDTYLIHW